MKVKLLVPTVPTAEQILPYLKRIDEAKWYTNFGKLVCELEERLADRCGAHVITTSSCTLGLELAYTLYKEMGYDEITISPLTFQATALAAMRAGLKVNFRDPDPHTWSDGTVAAFGLPAWRGPVIDAAAAFGEQEVPPNIVAVFSMHATKPLPAGEGGFIVTHDATEAEELRSMTNFGFLRTTRTAKYNLGYGVSRGMGTNAKLSEYHAAVALASLDMWDTPGMGTHDRYLRLFDLYEKHLPPEVVKQRRPRGVYPILAVKLPCSASPVMERLAEQGIETRKWYTPPLYRHPLFRSSWNPISFPVAEDLAHRLIGLPWHLHMDEAQVIHVCDSLTVALRGAG